MVYGRFATFVTLLSADALGLPTAFPGYGVRTAL
jgi:hypothetical protein